MEIEVVIFKNRVKSVAKLWHQRVPPFYVTLNSILPTRFVVSRRV